MSLLGKFHPFKIKNNEKFIQYISKILNLEQQIKDCAESISDATIIMKILGTMPPKYRNFRQAWLSVYDSKQNLSNLTARFNEEETSLSQSEQSECAFYASSRSKIEQKKRLQITQEMKIN